MKPEGVGSGTPLVYSKFSPGLSTGSSPTTPVPAHLLQPAMRVGDAPMACFELDGLAPEIGERDGIGPEKIAVFRRGAIGQKARHHLDLDLPGHGTVRFFDRLHVLAFCGQPETCPLEL